MDRPGLLSFVIGGGVTAVAAFYILKALFPWIKYDIKFIKEMGKTGITYKRYQRRNMKTIDMFEDRVRRLAKKTFLIFEDTRYTYEDINKQANKVANVALSLGLKKKDTVAMLQFNEPAFIWTYLGLIKIGVQPAFLNFNLRSKSLLHCFKVSEAKMLFIGQGAELLEAVKDIYADISNNNNTMDIYVQGGGDLPEGFQCFDTLMQTAKDNDIDPQHRAGITFKDTLNYIFTSGTTGLPKAAVVSQSKGVKGMLLMDTVGVTGDDVLYTPLPLYHSAAGLIALGTTIHKGATLVLRRKFSATQFFVDCGKYDVTVIQYIGELCRYLCAKKPADSDRAHKVRVAFGNGLREDIWDEFKTRFNIPVVGEFYAATEGNAGFINFYNKKGCIGRASPLLGAIYPMVLVKYDTLREQEVRDEWGKCIRLGPGEPGLMVSQIKRDFEFDGYKGNRELTEKKLIRNVFKQGDTYFNTGDMLVLDDDYFVYFKDRIGDTFRWKGENVSTIEVSNVVSDLSWIEDANVYGVAIPGQDGRAGMAAITLRADHTLSLDNLKELYRHCEDLLPSYARPRFLRFQTEMMITGTFKQQKFTLVKEGFDPAECKGDDLYYIDASNKTFSKLDTTMFQDIENGKMRL